LSAGGLIGSCVPDLTKTLKNESLIWVVGQHGGEIGSGIDISEAFNATIKARGDKGGKVVLPPVQGILYVSGQSLIIPDDTEVDFSYNYIKLGNGASKYLLKNSKVENKISGRIIIKNATFDGNRRGGQQRRYQTVINDPLYGEIYDYKSNYPGFCLLFDRVDNLYLENIKVYDSEAWSIAHFLCNRARFKNIEIKSGRGEGLNSDGITGVGTLYISIEGLSGYTNDDMMGISTSRATLQGKSIFNPKDGRDIEWVEVKNLRSSLNDQPSYVGIGLYFSDEKQIHSVIINGIYSKFERHIFRMGNYWDQHDRHTGIIAAHIDNVHACCISNTEPEIYFFSGGAVNLVFSTFFIARTIDNGFIAENKPWLTIENASVDVLTLKNISYYSDLFLLDDTVNYFIRICKKGTVGILSLELTVLSHKENRYSLVDYTDSDKKITLQIEKLCMNQDKLSFANISNSANVLPGNIFNVKISENIDDNLLLTRQGCNTYLHGIIQCKNHQMDIPVWALPTSDTIIFCHPDKYPSKTHPAWVKLSGIIELPVKDEKNNPLIISSQWLS